ncbi:glycosyltransferase family 39 protein [Telluribacter sp. SYSU D00476]|uniref:glycosyltransferase family 39 protein n=1 Tax=Telluribacter sp. SYSU D00476 TaxID=2811430 RepID=UPI001FF6A128|nr:glycosyltransferase family 39 protein [Telluribacter sp. SYSU D00476]
MKRYLALCLIVALGLLLRVYNLGDYAPYVDEKFTLLNAQGVSVGGANQPEILNNTYFTPQDFWKPKKLEDFFGAVARSDFGTHIVYNLLLHQWIKVFGLSDFYVRLLSALINTLTIVLLFMMVRHFLRSNTVALFAALLLAVEPLNVAQSHMARSYTLSFFLVVAASYIFLLLLKEQRNNRKVLYLVVYTLLASMSLLNHYLNFLILVSHALICLMYERGARNWILMSIAGVVSGGVLIWWLTAGGGQYSLKFLEDKNALHYKIAHMPQDQNPLRGIVDPINFKSVSTKVVDIFYDMNSLSNGLYNSVMGIRNFFVSLLLFGLILFIANRIKNARLIHALGALVPAVAMFFLYTGSKLDLFLVLFSYYILLLFIRWLKDRYHNLESSALKMVMLAVLMYILPMAYIIFDALKSGHTTSLSQRYIGMSIPFVIIIYAIGLREAFRKGMVVQVLTVCFLLLQGYHLLRTNVNIVRDTSPKYTYFGKPRMPNPYHLTADRITKLYSEGDTVLIPSQNSSLYSGVVGEERTKGITDAQYINLYLPKDARIIQRIDMDEPDKVFIKHKNGSRTLIFDFKGLTYRY